MFFSFAIDASKSAADSKDHETTGTLLFSFAIDASKSAADSKDHESAGTLLFSFAIDASKSAADSKDHETRTKTTHARYFKLQRYQRATESSADLVPPIYSGAAVKTCIG